MPNEAYKSMFMSKDVPGLQHIIKTFLLLKSIWVKVKLYMSDIVTSAWHEMLSMTDYSLNIKNLPMLTILVYQGYDIW